MFTQAKLSKQEFSKKIDAITTIENFLDFESFYKRLSQLNPKIESHYRYFEYWAENASDALYCLVDVKDDVSMHPIDNSIFNESDGLLVFWKDGDFELIRKNETYHMIVNRYLYSEDLTQKVLNDEEANLFQQLGVNYLQELAANIRLTHWLHQPVWIIKAQVKIEDKVLCSISFDGSDFHLTYIFVPADSPEEAVEKFHKNIESDYMSFVRIYSVKKFIESDYLDHSEDTQSVINSAQMSFARQDIQSYGIAPYLVTSFVITPYATIVSKWLCDHEYWASRLDVVECCEFFVDTECCFNRLLELQKISLKDKKEFLEISFDDEKINHYRVTKNKNRFEKIQRSFDVEGCVTIDWEDWYYDFYKKGEDYWLWVYLGGHADRTKTFKLTNKQVDQYTQLGIEYIRDVVKQVE